MSLISQKEDYGYEVEVIESEVDVQVTEVGMVSPDDWRSYSETAQQNYSKYTIRCTHEVGLPVMENVPPEEFLINQ